LISLIINKNVMCLTLLNLLPGLNFYLNLGLIFMHWSSKLLTLFVL